MGGAHTYWSCRHVGGAWKHRSLSPLAVLYLARSMDGGRFQVGNCPSAAKQWLSDHVEFAVGFAGRTAAGGAEPLHFQPMPLDPKPVRPPDFVDDLRQFRAIELDHFTASLADQMIVRGIAVIEFVDVAVVIAGDFSQ